MLKISVLSIIFFSLISCSGIKYEIREDNKESALLSEYLEEVIVNNWRLNSYDKIFLYDSLFALNKQLSDLVISKSNYPDTSISSALKNLTQKIVKSTPINFQQLSSIKNHKIYQSNLFCDPQTGLFDRKNLIPIKGNMPNNTKNTIVYFSQTAFSNDSKYLCFVISNIKEPNDNNQIGFGKIIYILTKRDNKWKEAIRFPLYGEILITP